MTCELGENLKKQVSLHDERITAAAQYSRNCNLAIKGIPVTEKESISQTLHQIVEVLQETIKEINNEVRHRVPVRKADAILKILFNSGAARNAMQCCKKHGRRASQHAISAL